MGVAEKQKRRKEGEEGSRIIFIIIAWYSPLVKSQS